MILRSESIRVCIIYYYNLLLMRQKGTILGNMLLIELRLFKYFNPIFFYSLTTE